MSIYRLKLLVQASVFMSVVFLLNKDTQANPKQSSIYILYI